VNCLAFSLDGELLAAGGDDQSVRLWTVADGALEESYTEHGAPVRGVTFAANGIELVSVSDNGRGRFWGLKGKHPAPGKSAVVTQKWETSPAKALAKARKDNRPILVDFFAPW
jgi:WD40 repeat protein